MAITQAVCTSFKQELLQGTHNFTATTGDTFKIALYTSSASLDATTTAFSTTNEVSNSGTYTSGGGTLTSVTPTTSGTTAICDFADVSFTSATITARGALIYNSTDSNKAVAVLDFGGDKTSTSGTFTIQFPTADASNAILRLAQEIQMALVINDRVKETTTTTGTGAVSLAGAVTGFETFAAGIGNSNTTYYVIAHQTAAEFEVGLGTLDGDSSDLTRTTVISSSNSDSAVSFAAGTKDVFCTIPATKLVFEDASNDVTVGNDLILGSDSSVLKFGADSDTTLTHTDGTGLTLNSTNKLLFRDSALYINSSTDGQLDIVADTEVQIAATTIDINGAVALNGAITGATNITLSGELDAATGDFSGDVDIDGTLEADAITINGTAIGSIYSAVAGSSSIVTTGALDSGSITSGFGTIDTGSSTITTTGLITGGSLDIDNVLINGTTIGHTDDTDLITVADGLVTVAGEISTTTLDIGGTNVTTTAAELNLIDGGTARGTTALADGDGILINDGGTMRMTNVTTVKTYMAGSAASQGFAIAMSVAL